MLAFEYNSYSLGTLIILPNEEPASSKIAFNACSDKLPGNLMAISKTNIFKDLGWELEIKVLTVVLFLDLQLPLLE